MALGTAIQKSVIGYAALTLASGALAAGPAQLDDKGETCGCRRTTASG